MNDENLKQNTDTPVGEKKEKKKGSFIFSVFIAVFIILIFGIGILNIIDGDSTYSEKENRVLSTFPTLSLNSIFEGTFMEKFETYMTDQFIFRDEIIRLKTLADRISGKKEVGGVYIGKKGFLFAKPNEYNEENTEAIAWAISDFDAKYPEMKKSIMIAPDSGFIYSDLLPANAPYPKQDYQLSDIKNYIGNENVTWIDLAKHFSDLSSDKDLYYKTDHHWTTRGAFEAFKLLMNEWEIDISQTEYEFYTVSNNFQGTLSSKAGVYDSYDTVEICTVKGSENSYVVSYDSLQTKTASFFDESKLYEKNQYEVFFGGNYDKITVTTTSQSKNTLLVIKDSYANCLIPMLTPYFNKIVVVDPRYLTDSLEGIIQENGFSHALFLYNLNTILEDTSLADCLAN